MDVRASFSSPVVAVLLVAVLVLSTSCVQAAGSEVQDGGT